MDDNLINFNIECFSNKESFHHYKTNSEDKNNHIFNKDVNFSIYWKVWNKIQSEFIDRPIPEPQLFYGSLMGLASSLGDPYTVFLEPKISKDFQEELKGRFRGHWV